MEDFLGDGWGWGGGSSPRTTPTPAAGEPPLTPLWAAYLAVLSLGLSSQVVTVVALVAAAVTRRWCRRTAAADSGADRGGVATVQEQVAAIVPCYLPNEASIVCQTVEHLLHRLKSLERLDVHLVYNTPHELPVEADLRAMAQGPLPEGRRLFVERVLGSRSKAENLNHALPRVEAAYTAVYDADHHPDPESLALAVGRLKATGVDCVQGSTYIRAGGCTLAQGLTQAEFFVTYFVMLPATEALTGTGFFGGANAVWLAPSLSKLRFDELALTEDIDAFLRASLDHGLAFSFLPECCSGELLPAGPVALWRQRLRWTMGWDQATLRHAGRIWAARLPLRHRLGLLYIFVFRWFALLLVAIVAIFNAIGSLRHLAALAGWPAAREPEGEPLCIKRVQLCSGGLYALVVAWALVQAVRHRPGLRLPCCVVLYFAALPAYVVFNSLLLMTSLARLASGTTGTWVVTRRAGAAPEAAAPGGKAEPLLDRPSSSLSWALLALALMVQGALAGSIVGYLLAQRTVSRPLWGWVPFGIGATRITYTDGRVVAVGLAAGLTASVVLLLTVRALVRCHRALARR
mmetsp:Transcript_48454/g.152236  ORF Transcript_48454/g.152236 Transcript_48454/m.152236 type:complete len:575 (+) Transcript_48454:62-1786(+)